TGTARQTDDYRAAEAQLKTTIKSLSADLKQKNADVRTASTATARAATEEKKLNTEYQNAVKSARQVSTELGNKNRALSAARGALDAAGISTKSLSQAERGLEAAVVKVRQEVLSMAPAYRAAQQASDTSTQKQVQNQRTLREGMASIGTQLQRIQSIAAVAIGGSYFGGMIKDVAATADEFKNLEARVQLATGEGQNFERSFDGVTRVALDTNSALDETGTLFARLTKASEEGGLAAEAAQQRALGLTQTINQATQLSGGSAESAKAAITQLIQGLQSGVLRGEEFNSVMEQAPRLAQAMAAGLGVTTGQLRAMAKEGELTAETVMRALEGQSAAVAAEFDKLPATVGRALQNLTTQWTLYVGASDKGLISSANVAKAIDALANNLDTLVDTLTVAGKIWAAMKIAEMATHFAAWATKTVAATVAMEANTAATATNTIAHRANATAVAAGAAAQGASAAAATANATAMARSGAFSVAAQRATSGIGAAAAAAAPRVGLLGRAVGGLSGLLGGPIGLIATTALLWPEIQRLGTWLGESAAKMMGYRDRSEEMAEADRRAAEASRNLARDQAALAQEAARAAS
ncbi:MAG: tape measure protein, partial [Hydrogenophaga sp.]|nr:tape measure protein [Hydrogenophaga sp.]